MKRRCYRATVTRDNRFWFVQVERVGATQARHLRELDAMARDLIALMTETDPESFDIEYDIQIPTSARKRIDRAEKLRERADRTRAQAAAELRAAARELSEGGLTLRDVGHVLGVSHQRAHQLVSQA